MLKSIFQGVRGLIKDKEEAKKESEGIVRFVPDSAFQEIAFSIRLPQEEQGDGQVSQEARYASVVLWNEIFGNEELFKTDYEALWTLNFCLYMCIFNILIKNNYNATALEAGMQYNAIVDGIKESGYDFIDAMLPGFKEAKHIVYKSENSSNNSSSKRGR